MLTYSISVYTYPWGIHRGMARRRWHGWMITYQDGVPTCSTNQAKCIATTRPRTLSQTASTSVVVLQIKLVIYQYNFLKSKQVPAELRLT